MAAAIVEGANLMKLLGSVVLPAAGPVVAATAIVLFVLDWNMLLVPLVLTGIDVRTLPVILTDFFTLEREVDWPTAAAKTVVTVEKIYDGNLLDDPTLAAGTLPGFYVESIVVAERGAWPLGLPDFYAADAEHLALYARMAATEAGFAEYLDKYVYEKRAA